MRGRCKKARYILAELLLMCVPDKELLAEHGAAYLNYKKYEMAQDVMAIMEQVQLQLQMQLKVDLTKIDTMSSL